jgi:hypothetical protein
MNNIISYSEIFESKKSNSNKKGSPLFETCKEFDFNGKLTVEQLRMIDELVITEDIGYLDLVAIKEGWDIEDISEEEYSAEMTFTEFLEREFYDLDVEGFAQCIVEDLGLEDLSEEELHEFCMVLNEDNFFGDYSQDEELNEFFRKIGKFFSKVGKGIANVAKGVAKGVSNVAKAVGKGVANAVKSISKISLKDVGKALKKALPIIIVVAAVALTCVGIPVGLALAAKAIGGIAKGAKAVGLALKAGKAAKLKAGIGKAMAKVKGGVAKLKAKAGIKSKASSLANKNKAWKKTLDIVKKGAEKVKDDLMQRGPEALESPDNHRISGTMAATYHTATEYADKLKEETKDFPDPEVAAKVDAQVNQMGGYKGAPRSEDDDDFADKEDDV